MGRTILFYGEAQMLSLCIFFDQWAKAVDEKLDTVFIDSNSANAGEALIAAAGDARTLVLQIDPDGLPDPEMLVRLMPILAHRTLVRVPLLAARCLWPFVEAGQDRPVDAASSATLGDSRLREIAVAADDLEAALDLYIDGGLPDDVDLDRRYKDDRDRWERADDLSDVKMARITNDRFRSGLAFTAPFQPADTLMAFMATAIAEQAGFPEIRPDENYSFPLGPDMPIHPAVQRHFCLDVTTFRLTPGEGTYRDWAEDYARSCRYGATTGLETPGGSSNPDPVFDALVATRTRGARVPFTAFDIACTDMFAISKAQLFQDVFVFKRLGDRRNGFFVEFGATDGVTISNSHMLEKHFGWTGILAEPFIFWHERLASNRDCIIDRRCVWTETGATLDFAVDEQFGEYATIAEFKDQDIHKELRERSFANTKVKTVSLDHLLDEHGAPETVDYLSIDTEGSELKILERFSFDRHKPLIITVEHNFHEGNRKGIHELMTKHGYVREMTELSRWDDWYCHVDLGPSRISA